jgi:hypothetical protein
MTRDPVSFPTAYKWYLALAAGDVLLTSLILELGGVELNSLADWVHGQGGMFGLSVLKFATVAVVVVCCEAIARRNARTGGRLAEWAVAISAIPVAVAGAQLVAAGAMGIV